MKINKLWEGYKFPTCEKCKKDCAGHLDYDNLIKKLKNRFRFKKIDILEGRGIIVYGAR